MMYVLVAGTQLDVRKDIVKSMADDSRLWQFADEDVNMALKDACSNPPQLIVLALPYRLNATSSILYRLYASLCCPMLIVVTGLMPDVGDEWLNKNGKAFVDCGIPYPDAVVTCEYVEIADLKQFYDKYRAKSVNKLLKLVNGICNMHQDVSVVDAALVKLALSTYHAAISKLDKDAHTVIKKYL